LGLFALFDESNGNAHGCGISKDLFDAHGCGISSDLFSNVSMVVRSWSWHIPLVRVEQFEGHIADDHACRGTVWGYY
jgi:hypothetical protein